MRKRPGWCWSPTMKGSSGGCLTSKPKTGPRVLLSQIQKSPAQGNLSSFRFLDQRFLPDDDDDAGIGDVEAATVGFEVVADFGVLGQVDVAVDDGAADA